MVFWKSWKAFFHLTFKSFFTSIIFLYHYRYANLFFCNCFQCCIYFYSLFTSKCVPWWNLDCARALCVKRAAWCSLHCKCNTLRHLLAFTFFKRFSTVFRKTISISENLNWLSYVSSLTSSSPLSALWRWIHKLSANIHPLLYLYYIYMMNILPIH